LPALQLAYARLMDPERDAERALRLVPGRCRWRLRRGHAGRGAEVSPPTAAQVQRARECYYSGRMGLTVAKVATLIAELEAEIACLRPVVEAAREWWLMQDGYHDVEAEKALDVLEDVLAKYVTSERNP